MSVKRVDKNQPRVRDRSEQFVERLGEIVPARLFAAEADAVLIVDPAVVADDALGIE